MIGKSRRNHNGGTCSSPVSNLSGITAIAAGCDHWLALTSSGTLYAWGDNSYDQRGNGTTTAQFISVDPLSTGATSPYSYASDNPVNFTDPSGALTPTAAQLCSFANAAACQAASAVPQYTPLNLCLRDPFAGSWNSNQSGGCRTTLSTSQGAQLIAATVVTTAATVATLGLGDLILPSIVAAYAEGGWGTFDAIHLGISLPFIFAPTVGIAGAGVWWGVTAITGGSEPSNSRRSGRC